MRIGAGLWVLMLVAACQGTESARPSNAALCGRTAITPLQFYGGDGAHPDIVFIELLANGKIMFNREHIGSDLAIPPAKPGDAPR